MIFSARRDLWEPKEGAVKSIMIEFLRYGGERHSISEKEIYIRTVGAFEAEQVSMTMNEEDCFQWLGKLRYDPRTAEPERQAALDQLAERVTQFLEPPDPLTGPVQLDLVTSARELWQLPFEAARTSGGLPLFVDPQNVIVPTRRVRKREFAERGQRWPARPRVLLISASPAWGGSKVPLKENQQALREALKPWIEPFRIENFPEAAPNEGSVLVTLKEASLEDVVDACQTARDQNKPFTHVHILTHGISTVQQKWPFTFHFNLALRSDAKEPARVEDLIRALNQQGMLPHVVTMCVCDSGNQPGFLDKSGSMAQELHVAGIPVVVASQLPLTFAGSEVLTRTFYQSLLTGKDLRVALHDARVALYHDARNSHDWLSMIAFVELPEGYLDHVVDVSLEADLAALKTAQLWVDHILEHRIASEAAFERVAGIITQRIDALRDKLEKTAALTSTKGVREENLGLLGSANKRLAELLFRRAEIFSDGQAGWRDKSRAALEQAHFWYKEGFTHNLSHHWTGVQYLSLEALLNGTIEHAWFWDAALHAAEAEATNPKEYWALGSIVELWMLGPCVGRSSGAQQATAALTEMRRRVHEFSADTFPMESMLRQLRRYTEWWTTAYGFFGNQGVDLAKEAQRLIHVIEEA
jgi:hypothetical protein